MTDTSFEHLLQALELSTVQIRNMATALRILLDAQEHGRPVSPETLAGWREQLANVEVNMARLNELIARLWAMLGREEPH